jgi:magnesium chelatase family protein
MKRIAKTCVKHGTLRLPGLAKLNTFALVGIDAVLVEAEVDNSFANMPKTVLVGLPEMAMRESVHRIERALVNLDYGLPCGRTVIN